MTQIEKTRHSLAHIMAYAVQELFPATRFGIGPAIENGFYYDFDFRKKNIASDNLPEIEQRMRELLKKNIAFTHKKISKAEARKLFEKQPYKLELITEIKEEQVGIYQSGSFTDLCRGPHVKSTKEIAPDAFKLVKIAGAYWRGSEKNPMLTRIYGVAFKTKKELQDYLTLQEEAEKRDHRVLGEKLDLFIIDKDVGKGLPLWLPKGYLVRHLIEEYMYELERENGYLHVLTPHLAKEDLYKTSGHLAHYKEDMYAAITIEQEKYYLRPMNCPHHHAIYKRHIRSYKELPLRLAEFGTVYRYERSGVLSGLIRTRGFTQNDAHIYTSPEKLEQEIVNVLKMQKKVYKDFHLLDYWLRLSLPDLKEKYDDTKNRKMWEEGKVALQKALKKLNLKFVEATGEATFYGPKIDIQAKDIYGREDTVATVQVDYYSAPRFKLSYIAKDGKEKPVVIIHRAIIGSFERFFAFLLEKTAGAFPVWLAPVQVSIIPVGLAHKKYAEKILKALTSENIRVELSQEDATVSKRIRGAELQKIPYLLVVGDKEVKAKSVNVRRRGKGGRGMMKLKQFIETIKEEIKKKKA